MKSLCTKGYLGLDSFNKEVCSAKFMDKLRDGTMIFELCKKEKCKYFKKKGLNKWV
jgi:hypothetical protein